VVAFRGGSVPEVIDDGVTGFIVDSLEEAIAATRKVHHLPRRRCRDIFEERFNATRMARDHVALYEQLLERRSSGRTLTGVGSCDD
jgi:glycosyltransferase involved in cell wall biosynthesis